MTQNPSEGNLVANDGESFEPSELGTKQHWDSVYEREVQNYREIGDTGEAWFGEDAVDKMVSWTVKNVEKSHRIIDLGSGNGHLLLELASAGFLDLVGVDYSENAVTLASEVLSGTELPEGSKISYHVLDLTLDVDAKGEKSLSPEFRGTFDVAMDKGTYDAICLNPEIREGEEALRDRYFHVVGAVLKPDGQFLITSCNWTQEEIIEQAKRHGFQYHSHVKYPTIKFGGVEGQRICTVAFTKA
ncbi:S-adenosyl-L-methionine-dependent methyltransferase [Gonapodya prolifera JEL478]|uniref:Protein-lysine N-methyltransferase EFM4 n=1 Tax=Gonapodya prolifera (strain JEL478) TaxID=1344416 RepID=A0A139ALF9_GONPJ|nr:S-adenosyl-L-methionine-dependent methyltransferase [Gonapodya prolifera JEL478]|eukprot:KXS17621.1 S-adenosyl-L-methionine-dependent methyltransferase [Gonapodya prolifera JEL478]